MRVTDRVNEYILNPHIIGERNRTAHYPSEASIISRTDGNVIGKCHRASYYGWKGIPKTNETDARGMWTMNFGKELENMYTEYIKQIGIWAGNNIKYYDTLHNISGEIDIVVFDGEIGGKTRPVSGIEIKTAYGYGFQKKVKVFPKIENLLQVALYLDYFKFPYWTLLYHSRDTMENLEYKIELIEEKGVDNQVIGKHLLVDSIPVRIFMLEDIYTRYAQLGEYVMANTLPPRDYTYGYDMDTSIQRFADGKISKTKLAQVKAKKGTDSDWQCLYCSYLDECWKEKRAEILK